MALQQIFVPIVSFCHSIQRAVYDFLESYQVMTEDAQKFRYTQVCKVVHRARPYQKPLKDRGRPPVLLCWEFLQKQYKFYELWLTTGLLLSHLGENLIDVELGVHYYKGAHI